MKKLYSLLFALLLSVGLLAACGETEKAAPDSGNSGEEQTDQSEKAAFPVTIKDGIGEEVTIENKPEKIVSLMPSNTEIAFELGLGDEIVGISDFDNYPEETASKEKIGGMEFNVEKIISLDPELVLAHASSAHNGEAGLQQLKDAGIAVLVVNDATSFDKVYDSIEMIGTATGESDEADRIVKDMKDRINEIKDKAADIPETDRKTVYVEVSTDPIFTTGKNTFMDEMLTIVNAKNAFADLEGWAEIDQEAVIEKNPDVVLTTHGTYTGDPVAAVMGRDGWQDVKAVQSQQIVDVNSDMVTRSGPRLAEGVEELAKAIYPDIFGE
ncbi:ABC transporter substrate-binding protein [Bacillus canaveralius]|uniref:ABC transporter substrate-binding protein n=1 Tax=Bacillus canaveralius TaxID=1403243 RepID=A0A2N5GRX6_9BACI|nr:MULTISPECIES: ABC transporter substrate-binding protein [Bacillus]PLR81135.1 ABC transporter substrate-binding protein [Bacillus sp. V33-4]PLR86318.1 ABC transporter substrate-binding protein [Bacillus canaveralius]PLR98551.1 ABC transporter substrate-binding protein [Bacillus canaveralius]RSK52602.1 ABC transporter substrate-binding protein [Bacillus canaveralius]